MKKNYAAWKIDHQDLLVATTNRDKLLFVARYGVLAPSLHNVQPWAFAFTEDSIDVQFDKSRLLDSSDPTMRESAISLGACVQNIVEAADACGFETKVSTTIKSAHEISATITFDKLRSRDFDDEKLKCIEHRVSDRSIYDQKEIPKSSLRAIERAYPDESVKIVAATGRTTKDLIIDLTMQAMNFAFRSPEFKKELSHSLHHNWTRRYSGMPGFTSNVYGLRSLILPYGVKYGRSIDTQINHEKRVLASASAFVLIFSKGDVLKYWLDAGRAYEAVLLMTTKLGLSNSTHAACVEAMDFHTQIEDAVSTKWRLQAVVRVGYGSDKIRHSPRYPLQSSITGA